MLRVPQRSPSMTTHDVVWMVTDSLQVPRTEYGPYNTRLAAEVAAVRLHARYLLRYEQAIGSDGELLAERVFAIKMPARTSGEVATGIYTRCATCGDAASAVPYRTLNDPGFSH